ncbi:g3052 [Coccomyxa elongata]
MRGTFVVPQKLPIVACNGVDGVRSFAASRKGKGLSRGQKITSSKGEEGDEKPKKKGPKTAYSLFQHQTGPAILAKHGPKTLADRSRILAAAWKNLSEAEKATYAAQIVVGSDKPPVSLPRSTYQLFMRQSASEILAKHPEVNTIGDRSKLLAAEWKKVSSEDKARLAAEMEKIAPAKLKKSISPTNKYARFVKENYHTVAKENSGLKSTEVMAKVASLWKTMTDSEKAAYSTKA